MCQASSMPTTTRHGNRGTHQIELEFEELDFEEGGKLENLENNTQSRDKNREQT